MAPVEEEDADKTKGNDRGDDVDGQLVEEEHEARMIRGAGQFCNHDGGERFAERREPGTKANREAGNDRDLNFRLFYDRKGIDDLDKDDCGEDRGYDARDEAEDDDKTEDDALQREAADHADNCRLQFVVEPVDQEPDEQDDLDDPHGNVKNGRDF